MVFPEVERSIYKQNPLDNVLCQLRFPPILKINTGDISAFQDDIRSMFPEYSEQIEIINEITLGPPNPFQQNAINQFSRPSSNKNHLFTSADGKWKVNLTNTFISLSTSEYTKWEVFRDKLLLAQKSFIAHYKPSYFSRIGLRYVNIFCRTGLGMPLTKSWGDLIESHYNGVFSTTSSEQLRTFKNVYEFNLEKDFCTVKTLSAFINKKDNGEQCLLIDNDYSMNDKTAIDNAEDILNYLNGTSTRLIRWIISDELHKAMGPQKQ